MQSYLPTDEELAKLYRWTLHTKWGISGARGSGIGAEDDFRCMCDSCRNSAQGSLLENNRHKRLLPPAPAVQLLFAPVVEMSPGGSYVVAVDTAAI